MIDKPTPLICVICRHSIPPDPRSGWAHGHNALPVTPGRCCSDCNAMIVVPRRIAMMRKQDNAL